MPTDISSTDHAIAIDPDDLDNNSSTNPSLHDVMAARMHRRHVLKGGVGALTMASLGTLGLSACGGSDDDDAPASSQATTLGFNAVSKATGDALVVAPGYTATVIYATGDSLAPSTPAYTDDGQAANFAQRAGDHHDGIHYFGLNASGSRDNASTDRALLTMNHENIAGTVVFMHPAGQTNAGASAGPRPEAEAQKEIEAHGVSIVEIAKTNGAFKTVQTSPFNRRITAGSLMQLSGPVRGSKHVKTLYSPNGFITRGTINNCGSGTTPWGTYVTAEENWAGYFRRDAGDAANRSARENATFLRNGMRPGAAGNNRWSTVVPADTTSTEYSRWNCTADITKPADGTGDFRNVQNTFGYIVEIDPYDPLSTPRKRTAMGRRANEGASHSIPTAGQSLAFYIGCDSRGEYVYKFVTKATWDAADAQRGLAAGNKYLDEGKLYVARCNADGTGTWLLLDLSNPAVAAGVPVSAQNPAGYVFEDLADICVNTRLAADAAGGTRMDRPEWTAVNPNNGEVYITMTENPDRGSTATVSGNNFPNPDVDGANPRYWRDTRTDNATVQRGNVHGHVLRLREDGDRADATSFRWDVFLFGAQAAADTGEDDVNYQANVNISGLSPLNDLSKPDGCWFSKTTGILWLQTDDNTMTDRSNAMMLAAIPGRHGDGAARSVVNKPNGSPNTAVTTDKTVPTFAGRRMTDTTFKRFLVAPKGAEITGVCESADGRALFVNIQHPGENTLAADIGTPSAFESHWPGNGAGIAAPYGPGGATARPRSATIVITKNDGGVIGV